MTLRRAEQAVEHVAYDAAVDRHPRAPAAPVVVLHIELHPRGAPLFLNKPQTRPGVEGRLVPVYGVPPLVYRNLPPFS